MIDGCRDYNEGFQKASNDYCNERNTLGVAGAWFVNGSRDYFTEYMDDEFIGYEVSNCCGNFILAIKR